MGCARRVLILEPAEHEFAGECRLKGGIKS